MCLGKSYAYTHITHTRTHTHHTLFFLVVYCTFLQFFSVSSILRTQKLQEIMWEFRSSVNIKYDIYSKQNSTYVGEGERERLEKIKKLEGLWKLLQKEFDGFSTWYISKRFNVT